MIRSGSVKLLGIDPGSRYTGYGVIEGIGKTPAYLASGCIKVTGDTLAEKLQCIFLGITQIVSMYQPDEVAIEQIFLARNADSALKLGQARGVAILAVAQAELPLAEYSAKRVKQSVVGRGNASKDQVQHMVASLLKLSGKPQADAADALAIALCHFHTRQSLININGATRVRDGRLY